MKRSVFSPVCRQKMKYYEFEICRRKNIIHMFVNKFRLFLPEYLVVTYTYVSFFFFCLSKTRLGFLWFEK